MRTRRLIALIVVGSACSGSPTLPDPGALGVPDPPQPTLRVVPIFLLGLNHFPGGTTPVVRATFQGRTLSSTEYHVFNLAPGTYELTGTLVASSIPNDRDVWAVGFSTFRGVGNPPPITDNGVAPASIRSLAGPNPSIILRNCEVDYFFPEVGEREFRISFTVTAGRATGATCPVQT